nr:MAG TPA: hypothetical protein [Caudoviricetes sp.]
MYCVENGGRVVRGTAATQSGFFIIDNAVLVKLNG